jgi:predicted nucleotidyltransferase component of viral defense system
MKKERLAFPFKTVDLTKPEQIKVQLQREKLNKPGNFQMTVNEYLFGPIAKYVAENGGDEVIIGGGKAIGVYVDPYRMSNDLDIKTEKPERVIEMVNDYVNDEKDIKYTVDKPRIHSSVVQKLGLTADLNGLTGKFDIDIVPESPVTLNKGRMRKMLSVDEEYDAMVPSAEELIAGKLNRLIWMVSRPDIESFPIRDLYDIYKVGSSYNLERGVIRAMVRDKIMFDSDWKFLQDKRRARDNMPELIEPYVGKKWKKFGNKNVVDPNIQLDAIVKFTSELAKEIDF